MTPTDLGLTSKVLLDSVTDMFTHLGPWLVVIIPVTAIVIGVKMGINAFRKAGKGKTA